VGLNSDFYDQLASFSAVTLFVWSVLFLCGDWHWLMTVP